MKASNQGKNCKLQNYDFMYIYQMKASNLGNLQIVIEYIFYLLGMTSNDP